MPVTSHLRFFSPGNQIRVDSMLKYQSSLIKTPWISNIRRQLSNSAPERAIDPKSPSFSPIRNGNFQEFYKSPYATVFPSQSAIPQSVPLERPYERLIKLRRLIRKSSKGKLMRYDAWVLAGNKNGSAGMAHAHASQAYKAVQAATRRAKSNMRHFNLYEGRTLYHDIQFEYKSLRMRLMPKPPGYSVRAQRNVEDVCSALGVQDLAAQIMQGKTNPITITRAMFHALENLHKTPESVAKLRGMTARDVRRNQG